ncbi:hypothetical protein BKI52_14165 [marine bacterium AO1-C]|nr:hypothetical protein BKI52_14165 [marine bacterium AO1-C]
MGLAVGDALGIPVEFYSRKKLAENPVTGMRSGGTYETPAGTWSVDGSLTFCVAESLLHGFQLQDIANKFTQFLYQDYWTARGEVFDVGVVVAQSIERIKKGTGLTEAGGNDEMDNGNGALNYTLPLGLFHRTLPVSQRFTEIAQLSSLTNRHLRSILGAFIFSEMGVWLMRGGHITPQKAYDAMTQTINELIEEEENLEGEARHYHRILHENIAALPEGTIQSTAYIVHSLEACFWCLLNGSNYSDTVLKAVNLGEDADTIGAMTGALAGLYYGYESIPEEWITQLARKDDILKLSEEFYQKVVNVSHA